MSKILYCTLLIATLSILANTLRAQHQELQEKPAIWKGKLNQYEDSSSLLYAFKTGKVEGHFRYFFSATDNNRGLTDYYANAFGGGLRYETAKFYGFQMAVSGFYIFNIGSSDLTRRDSLTKLMNRYEIGLFDVQDPSNKNDLDRLEEFYIKYNFRKSFLKYGRQLINTPFINLQDGRMRPTGVEGIWFELNEIKKVHAEGGWIYAISPRSTVRWFSTAHSIGVYPMGVTTNGNRSNYFGNIDSKGVFLLGIRYHPVSWITISGWNMFLENVMNTTMLQVDFKNARTNGTQWILGAQFIRQDAVNNGGNNDPEKRYIDPKANTMTAGIQLGYLYRNLELTGAYNRIFANGRYLMPREWGRDPFFTFLPRERNEGLGDVHATTIKLSYNFPAQNLRTSLAGGYYHLPDVKNYRLNKYGMPSYTQLNFDLRLNFKGFLNGLDMQMLVVAKFNHGNIYNDKRFEFNKVNMVLYNLVFNYHF
ncbi:MAG: OprD family outer membrane porin [Chitinophagales bacterium]|nr:OprD family outer membrane porin [Chitinophagales bacterium]MDW8272967.1 OprD family outer membrane porin [Chitinophagales bacterium]